MGAFAQLVQIHRPRALRTAYGMVGSVDEAEDVVQDALVKVWNRLPEYRLSGSFSSWLYRITVNTAIDVLRKRTREQPLQDWQRDDQPQPEERVLQRGLRERVRDAVDELPPNSRATIILREFEQLSYKEIAETLGIPIGTVMSRLNYARRLLRSKLSEQLSETG